MTHDKTRRLRRCKVCRSARTRSASRLCIPCQRTQDSVEWLVDLVMSAAFPSLNDGDTPWP